MGNSFSVPLYLVNLRHNKLRWPPRHKQTLHCKIRYDRVPKQTKIAKGGGVNKEHVHQNPTLLKGSEWQDSRSGRHNLQCQDTQNDDLLRSYAVQSDSSISTFWSNLLPNLYFQNDGATYLSRLHGVTSQMIVMLIGPPTPVDTSTPMSFNSLLMELFKSLCSYWVEFYHALSECLVLHSVGVLKHKVFLPRNPF